MDAIVYTISTGVNKWSAKIEITGWAMRTARYPFAVQSAQNRTLHARGVYLKMGWSSDSCPNDEVNEGNPSSKLS